MKICAIYRFYNAASFAEYSMKSVYDHVDRILVANTTVPWNGDQAPLDYTWWMLRNFPDPQNKMTVLEADWKISQTPGHSNEIIQLNALTNYIRSQMPEITHAFIVDYDEVYNPDSLVYMREAFTAKPDAEIFRGTWRCYWKSLHWWIDPVEPSRPLVGYKITDEVKFTSIRNLSGKEVQLDPRRFIIHHFSYAIPTEELKAKIANWSHATEIVPHWVENVWEKWGLNKSMENIHPVHPDHYKKAVPADKKLLPAVMRSHPYFPRETL